MPSPKKYILSGAPGSGKSTLIDAIATQGIPVMREVSRSVIIQEQAQQQDGMPWKDVERFSELVFQQTVAMLEADNEALLCDRSLIDNIAYLQHAQKPIPQKLAAFSFDQFYHQTVFFTLPWKEIYTTDPQRPESFEEQCALSQSLQKAYLQYGFELIQVPFQGITERVDFILNQIKYD